MKVFASLGARRVLCCVAAIALMPALEPRTLLGQSANARHAALTIEGGGTLGAYEGGMTWALLEVFRRRRIVELPESVRKSIGLVPLEPVADSLLRALSVYEIHAIAGASAGSINAFIAANRWCSLDPFVTEDSSSFWSVWTET